MKGFHNFINLWGDIDDSNFKFSFGVCPWFMRFMGIWPIDDYRCQKFKYFVTLAAYVFNLYWTSTSIFTASSRTEAIKRIPHLVIAIATIIKLIVIKWKKHKLKQLLDLIRTNWEAYRFESLEAKRVMTAFANRGRFVNHILILLSQIRFYYIVMTFTVNFHEDEEVADGKIINAVVPLKMWNHKNLIFLYAIEVASSQIHAWCAVTMDTFFMIIVLHAASKYEIIRMKIEHGAKNNSCLYQYDSENGTAIKEHSDVTRLVGFIEDCFHFTLLIDFLKYIVNCGMLIHLIRMFFITKNVLKILECGAFMYTINFFMFLMFLLIQQMIDASEKVGLSAYLTTWNEIDSKKCHYILLMILRAQNSNNVTAGKFFKFSMEIYKNVLVKAVSYALVLFAMLSYNQ